MSQTTTARVHAWRVRTGRQDSVRIPVAVLAQSLDSPAIRDYLTAEMIEAIKEVAGAEDVAVIEREVAP